MGVAYNNLKEYHKAISYFTKAIKAEPNDTTAYANRGGVYDSIGEYQKSLNDFEEALKIDLDYYDVYRLRNYTYQSLWRKETDSEKRINYIRLQIADLEHAIDLNPEDDEPRKVLRKLFRELSERQLDLNFMELKNRLSRKGYL